MEWFDTVAEPPESVYEQALEVLENEKYVIIDTVPGQSAIAEGKRSLNMGITALSLILSQPAAVMYVLSVPKDNFRIHILRSGGTKSQVTMVSEGPTADRVLETLQMIYEKHSQP